MKENGWKNNTQSAMAALDKLDLESIRWKLTDKNQGLGWSEKKAKEAEAGYLKFLTLQIKYPEETLVPTMTVDEVWHAHVLHTKKYQDDCNMIFGEMLHHNPRFTPSKEESEKIHSNFTRTIELFEKEFGVPSPAGAVAFCLDQRDCDGKCD